MARVATLFVFAFLGIAAGTVDAVPIVTDVIVLQNEGFSEVSLITNPGALIGPSSPLRGSDISFGIVFAPPVVDEPVTFALTLSLTGLAPVATTVSLNLTAGHVNLVLPTLDPGDCCHNPTPGTLALTIGGETNEFRLSLQQPVPESSTVALMGAGVIAVAWFSRRQLLA
jgi:hypothetical protein